MALPEQIQRQADAARELMRAPGEQTEVEQTAAPVEPQVTETVTTPPEPEHKQEQVPPPSPEMNIWEQRYRALKGKYDREVPHYAAQNRDFVARIEDLQGYVEQLEAHIEGLQSGSPAQPNGVSAEEKDKFGEDLVDLIERRAREVAKEMVASELSPKVNQLEQQVQQVNQDAAVTKEQQFFIDLDLQIPVWRKLDRDQGFNDWLDDVEGASGRTRRDFLDYEVKNRNASRVRQIIELYLQSGVTAAPPPPAPTRPDTTGLEQQIAPARRGGSAPADNTDQGRSFTAADIKKFYDDVTRGQYRGREAERQAMQKMIFDASKAGRIQ